MGTGSRKIMSVNNIRFGSKLHMKFLQITRSIHEVSRSMSSICVKPTVLFL